MAHMLDRLGQVLKGIDKKKTINFIEWTFKDY